VRSHAAAFAWELGRRYRWGWIAICAYLAWLLVIRMITLATGTPMLSGWGAGFAFAVLVPGTAAVFWLAALFTHGHGGNIAARQSMFPSRLLTLPVTNTALTVRPMLTGAAAMALLWIAVRALAPWPANPPINVPYLWPGLLMIVQLAWLQPIIWMSYPLAGLRVAVAVLWLTAVGTACVIAIEYRASEMFMIAMLLPQFPLAYLMALHAVSRARCGDAADWSSALERIGHALAQRGIGRRPFASPEAAQFWLEWKRYGRSLPALVAMLLPVELLLLGASKNAPALVFIILVMVALTPPFMASFTAVSVRRSGDGNEYAVSPFTATRPLSSAAMVEARLRMAALSTTAAWVLVIAAVPVALVWSETWAIVADRAQRFAGVVGTARAIAFGTLVLAGLLLTTWRQMVQSLYLGLTGRAGLIKGSALAALCLVIVFGLAIDWAWSSGLRAWFWVTLYSVLGVIVAMRMVLASWIVTRLHRDRLLADRALLVGAAVWLAAVLMIYGVLLWLFSTPYMPRFLLLLAAIVSVPLVRVSAAPLALAWNRHR
jgi:hypothetical protein